MADRRTGAHQKKFPVLLEKFLYSSIHTGDSLSLEDVMNLQKELKHQEGFVCGEGLANIPAEKIVSNIKRRVAWANMLGAFGAGMRQTTTTVNSNATVFDNRGGMVTGTGTATITAPDKQVQAALLH